MTPLIGLVGKPSAGKTTLLNVLAHTNAKTADYPFTTIKPNVGVGFVTTQCVCTEFGVKCEPRTLTCVNGIRQIPIRLIDVAGLVPGAHLGKGMGNQFLTDLATADALIHVVDISGSLNEKGEAVEPGTYDPLNDITWLEDEITYWFMDILKRGWDRLARRVQSEKVPIVEMLLERFSGLKVTKVQIQRALARFRDTNPDIQLEHPKTWTDEDIFLLCRLIREYSKPIVIAANKIDRPTAKENYERLKKKLGDEKIVPMSALAESVLQQFAQQKKIDYSPFEGKIVFKNENKFDTKEKKIIERIKSEIIDVYGSTGVYNILPKAVFDVLEYIPIYPVADASKLTDNEGRVLPDVFLVPKNTTAREFAGYIHKDLEKNFIHAINARTNRRIGENHELKANDVIKIVAAV